MDQKTSNPWKNFALAGGAVFILWLAFFFVVSIYGGCFTKTGPFGDSFGVLNTLFTGLAFAGMICTLLMQRQELTLQREEIRLALAEYNRIAEANEEAAKVAKENLEEQKRIANMNRKYLYKQILSQRFIAEINCIHKKIELTCTNNAPAASSMFKEHASAIDTLLAQLNQIKND